MKTSDSTINIFPAIVKAQGEMVNPPKNADNPFFKSKYADLPSILDITRPVLAENGLGIMVFPLREGCEVLLSHGSGEWIYFDNPMPLILDKDTMQGEGSAITYARRQIECALFHLAADTDDDGNAASQPEKPVGNTPAPPDGPPAEKKEKTPGGASFASLGLARGLFFQLRDSDGRTIAIEPENGETPEVTDVRREQNCFSIAEWLTKKGFDSTGHDDELLHMNQVRLSQVIDKIKAEIAEMDVG